MKPAVAAVASPAGRIRRAPPGRPGGALPSLRRAVSWVAPLWVVPLWVALAWVISGGDARAQSLNFGETYLYAGCLRISAESYSGRQGDFNNQDWVTMKITNGCDTPLKHLEVALVLIDAGGTPYGTTLWLLGRGIFLPPGKSRTERFAVPDPDNRIAVRWTLEVLQISRVVPKPRRRAKKR